MGQKLGGIIQVTANGAGIPIHGSFEFMAGGIKRTIVIGQDGIIHGWTEEVEAAEISGKLVLKKGTDYDAIFNMVNGTVKLTLAPTCVFNLESAVYTGDKKVDTKEGTVDFKVGGEGKLVML